MRRPGIDPPALRALRHLLWGVAVVCLGVWGWARLDAAQFQAGAERRLERSLAAPDAEDEAESEAAALERAVEADLRRLVEGAPADAGERAEETGPPAAAAAAQPAVSHTAAARQRNAENPAVDRAGTTVALGRLRMPRIGLSTMVAEGVDRRTLRRAAGRIPGTAPLGGDGNTGIAGHRDGVFRDLERAAAGDLILVETPAGTQRYRVEAVSIVHPGATEVLAADGRPTLTLVTCYPFDLLGPAPDRWVVRARRVDSPTG
jgi:LPXTG-site transpeptidase (sortase) family protein